MSAAGTWNVTVNSPMGAQPSTLTLAVDGGAVTGTQSAQGNTSPIANAKIDGDTVTWSNSITTPFPMTLEFTGKVDGDTLNGTVKAGAFGSFPFTGSRA
ncbi:MAG: hypothetical protein P4L64_02435 [Caulobacteraceae bacterium]|nr:hypothetical protein [Caulobacteraceae bacterium]